MEQIAAQIQADARHYATLKIAATVLQRGIERFREQNQVPVLKRASELFAQLTVGSFDRLCINYDEQGQAVLEGLRPSEQSAVGVSGMSDGSRDQLYLALRLATLEAWLENHEPLPFIVDDILVNFDDARAIAALQALGELSKKTQVLFFTHHRHLVDLAQRHLDEDVLFVQELAR
jgi:uncharacterized protein YhaN